MRAVQARKLLSWLEDPRVLLVLYLAAAVITALQKIDRGSFQSGGMTYPPFQNYVIFRNAFHHLVAGQDLYARFPLEQADLFKYTPTFALLMAPIAALPYSVGAAAWNLLNAAALFGAVMWIPGMSRRTRSWTLWFVSINLVSSMQSAQSNGLMAGLMLGAFAARERGLAGASALAVALASFVKPFGVVALLPCLFQPRRVRFLLYVFLSAIALSLAPLLVVSVQQLALLYGSWLGLLQSDHAVKTGTSLITWLRAWFGLAPPKELVVAAGGVLLLLPMAGFSRFRDAGARLLLVASVLIWVVIFNHMAEPPTYVIAVLGVALWFFSQRPTPFNIALVVLTLLLTCLAATDLYPRSVRANVISPYVLRAAPCIFVWFKLQYDLLGRRLPAPTSIPSPPLA